MLEKKTKDKIIAKFRTHSTDTGSPPVQIAILTEEIRELIEHLKKHNHDYSSRRGLLKKVDERRRLLRYLEREDPDGFNNLVKRLKLKIAKHLEEEKPEPKEVGQVEQVVEVAKKENEKKVQKA